MLVREVGRKGGKKGEGGGGEKDSHSNTSHQEFRGGSSLPQREGRGKKKGRKKRGLHAFPSLHIVTSKGGKKEREEGGGKKGGSEWPPNLLGGGGGKGGKESPNLPVKEKGQ